MQIRPDASRPYSSRNVIVGYVTVNLFFTLAASLIWAINTIFLIRDGGLSIFQVMLVNAVFTVGQMAFEIPTGVVADTIGRRASILFAMITLMLSTLLYVLTPPLGLGIAGFMVASVILGLGFTFQTGAVDAWMVDALDATGWDTPKDRVFAWGQTSASIGMLVGSVLGGVLGQFSLALPYVLRTVLLGAAAIVVAVLVRDAGFVGRPLRLSTFGAEASRIFNDGVRFGWRSRVIRPLFWVSALTGVFFIYGFYSWQPYILELLGRDYVWLLGVVQAFFSGMGILGNMLVHRVMSGGTQRRSAPRVLAWTTSIEALLTVAIALVGLIAVQAGFVPAGAAIALWLMWGFMFGLSGPIRMGYINEHIPSAQRATVLSLDAFFADGGGAAGQPALGWISQRVSIPIAWLIGGAFMATAPLLYRVSGKAAAEEPGRPATMPVE